MTHITMTIEEVAGFFYLVMRNGIESHRYPANTRSVAEVMMGQEERRLGLRPAHLTTADLVSRKASPVT